MKSKSTVNETHRAFFCELCYLSRLVSFNDKPPEESESETQFNDEPAGAGVSAGRRTPITTA